LANFLKKITSSTNLKMTAKQQEPPYTFDILVFSRKTKSLLPPTPSTFQIGGIHITLLSAVTHSCYLFMLSIQVEVLTWAFCFCPAQAAKALVITSSLQTKSYLYQRGRSLSQQKKGCTSNTQTQQM